MSDVLSSATQALILSVALSVDAFLAAFAYGGQKIKVPAASVATIGILCGLVLLVTLKVGTLLGPMLGESVGKMISFLVLLILGAVRLADSFVKSYIRKRQGRSKELEFSAFNLRFILRIYADPQLADADSSNALSVKEAVALSIALSLDGIAAGVGAGITGLNTWLTVGVFVVLTVLAIKVGCALGNRIAGKLKRDISWISGAMLMVLAFIKML